MYSWNNKSRLLILILLAGDIAALAIALWASVTARYLAAPPDRVLSWAVYKYSLGQQFAPFAYIFLLWILAFYIAGFYSTFMIGYRLSLAQNLLKVHLINSIIAVLFFYLIPYFAITPKASLVLYLFFSYAALFFWRSVSMSFLKNAVGKGIFYIIGPSRELSELVNAIKYNPYYNGFRILGAKSWDETTDGSGIDFASIGENARSGVFTAVVAALPKDNEEIIKMFYKPLFEGVQFFGFQKFYESVFHKIPVSLVNEMWLLENISSYSIVLYDISKRVVDILVGFILGTVSLLFYPFIILAIKLDDGGPIFYVPKRVGQGGKIFNLFKFRTMRAGAEARWPGENDPRVTRIGRWLRKTSLDECPQLWNVCRGDISLVGPRPDLLDFAGLLRDKIPYYDIRTLVKPGLTGWAQVSQRVRGENPSSVEETQDRLAYDIYYIKHRSFLLDLAIILKTIHLVLSRLSF